MISFVFGMCCSVLIAAGDDKISVDALSAEKSLKFRFRYEFELERVPADAKAIRVWVPIPRRDAFQDAELAGIESPAPVRFTQDAEYGNRIAYSEVSVPANQSPLRWQLVHTVTRREWRSPVNPNDVSEPDAPLSRYLKADRLVPTGGFIKDVARDIGTEKNQPLQARTLDLYRYVMRELEYRKDGTGWGRGDVAWVCDSKYGNCSDFHSLFISLCRTRGVAAKFEMGFPLPYTGDSGEIPGYHCWAKFLDPEKGWFAVDASEANKHPELSEYFYGNLHARRVHLSTGRDITLEPRQDGPPVNFLIYPYVEIDGKPHDGMKRTFSFEMVKK
jgi:transglutaminase-like putative cysteine protease